MNLVTVRPSSEELPIRELIQEFGSPLMLLDCDIVRQQFRSLQNALPGARLYYAIKSMPEPAALSALAAIGASFDVATTGELQLLTSIAADPAATIHTHPVKRDSDIRDALDFGCTTFVVDNIDELAKFAPYRDRAGLLLRVSFRGRDAKCDLSRKFGCDPADIPYLLTQAAAQGIRVVGLSFHVGSQSLNSEAHVEAIRACRTFFNDPHLAGAEHLRTLDIGGGFPADYSKLGLDINDYCAPIREALAEYPAGVRIIAEPGRFISAPSMRSVSTVMGRARRGSSWWYYLDDGVYGAYSGQIFDHAHYPITIFNDALPLEPSVLAGPTCDSIDVITEDALLPPMQVGDIVLGEQMGAYTMATACEFNSIPKPKLVVLNQFDSDAAASQVSPKRQSHALPRAAVKNGYSVAAA